MELNLTLTAGTEIFGATAPTGFYIVMATTETTGTTATIADGDTGYFVLQTTENSTPVTRYISLTASGAPIIYGNPTGTEVGYIDNVAEPLATTGNTLTLYGATFVTT